jgi:uncharacterized lipoprotein YmbA
MKKTLCLIVMILALFLFVGCANQQAYTAYANAMASANAYKKAPGLVQEFDATGKLVKQTLTLPDDGVQIAQIKDSEWAQPVSQFLNLAVLGGSNALITRELVGFAKSARANTVDSHDYAGGNIGGTNAGANMAGGDVSVTQNPVTTTSMTTTTTTNPAP